VESQKMLVFHANIKSKLLTQAGAIYTHNARALPENFPGHTLSLSTNLLYKSHHSFNFHKIANHFFHCPTSERNRRLDGSATESTISMDGAHPFCHTNDESRDESGALGKLSNHRKRTGSVGWTRPSVSDLVEGWGGIRGTPRQCGGIHSHAASSVTISLQVLKSTIPNSGFRTKQISS
jgi:hypothetical protein